MGNAPSTPFQTCLRDVCAGRAECVAFAGAPFYQLAWVKPFNLDVPAEPVAVLRPQDAEEVAAAVRCASEYGVHVQAKSGGHSYANFGLADGGLMLDLAALDSFSMDESSWLATVGAGTRLGDMDDKLHNAGERAVAHGICPGVGLGGHATIGGLGAASRMWGSCLDHVVEVEVVTAAGEIVTASEEENEDLFWALRGAGASFGIVTKFTLKTHPEPGTVVQRTYAFTFGSHAAMAPVFAAWQTLISDPSLDRRFSSEIVIQPLGIVVTATFFGTEAEFEASGIPARIPRGGKVSGVVNDWLASLLHEAGNEALYLGSVPAPFYSKALGFTKDDLLSEEGIEGLFRYIDDADKGTLLWFIIFDVSGGAINDISLEAASYPHRDKVMYYQSYAVGLGALPQATRRFVEQVHGQVERASGANTTYAGYVDLAIPREIAEERYWEGQVPRLRRVKAAWDPGNVFSNPHSVRPEV